MLALPGYSMPFYFRWSGKPYLIACKNIGSSKAGNHTYKLYKLFLLDMSSGSWSAVHTGLPASCVECSPSATEVDGELIISFVAQFTGSDHELVFLKGSDVQDLKLHRTGNGSKSGFYGARSVFEMRYGLSVVDKSGVSAFTSGMAPMRVVPAYGKPDIAMIMGKIGDQYRTVLFDAKNHRCVVEIQLPMLYKSCFGDGGIWYTMHGRDQILFSKDYRLTSTDIQFRPL